MKTYFSHERLEAYQQSLEFIRWTETVCKQLPKSASAANQLGRAGTSIALNIAEGNSKATAADKCRFCDMAHGSALECTACLDVPHISGALTAAETDAGKTILSRAVALLTGLIKSKMPDHWLAREAAVESRVGISANE